MQQTLLRGSGRDGGKPWQKRAAPRLATAPSKLAHHQLYDRSHWGWQDVVAAVALAALGTTSSDAASLLAAAQALWRWPCWEPQQCSASLLASLLAAGQLLCQLAQPRRVAARPGAGHQAGSKHDRRDICEAQGEGGHGD